MRPGSCLSKGIGVRLRMDLLRAGVYQRGRVKCSQGVGNKLILYRRRD